MGRWKGREIYKRWTKIYNFQLSTLSRVCLLLKLHTIYYQHLIIKSKVPQKINAIYQINHSHSNQM